MRTATGRYGRSSTQICYTCMRPLIFCVCKKLLVESFRTRASQES
jgi:hypothetical protein